MDPLKIYSPVKDHRNSKSACNYYRVEVPIKGLFALRLAEGFIDDGKFPEEESLQMVMSADIDLLYSLFNMDHIIDAMRKDLKPGPDYTGKTRYPPSVVFDTDDNIEWVHPTNPAFSYLGVRAPDGTLLRPGDEIRVKTDNEEVVLWRDMETLGPNHCLFNIQKNHENLEGVKRMVKKCDGFTFPSKYLGEFYKEAWGIPEYYVFPNTVIPEDYFSPKLAPHEGVRILWQGGFSHAIDLAPLADAFTHLAQKHPQAKFIFWGTRYRGVYDGIPESQVEMIPWQDYGAYRPIRVMIDADINICPLEDNLFNRCKSAIKWYEASLIPNPEVTLASRVPPYSDEIVDGETGFLFTGPEEFVSKMDMLIENAETRKRVAENAKRWVLDNRHYKVTCKGLYDYYVELRNREKAKWEEPKLISLGV